MLHQKFVNSIIVGLVSLLGIMSGGLTAYGADDQIKIGILQYVEHKALDAARQGFEDTLNDSKYADKIVWDVQNASGDQANLQSITDVIARNNDILYAIATPAAQGLAAVEHEKPIFISAVTDPVEAGLVDSMEKPGTNVTGTSDMQPIEDQVDLLVRNFPEAKNIGLIYNSSEINSEIQASQAVKLLEEKGLKTHIATITSSNDIASVLGALIKEVDAMFMVTDNTIDNSIVLVGDMLKEAGIPMVGSSDAVVMENGLATLSNSYYDYGVQTAEMVIRMLDEDLDPATMPVELGKDFEVVVNPDFAEALGLDPATIK